MKLRAILCWSLATAMMFGCTHKSDPTMDMADIPWKEARDPAGLTDEDGNDLTEAAGDVIEARANVRGSPADFDPGPPPGSKWAEMFARVPNYRSLGVQMMRAEKFRWFFGPMFYRGRLGPNQVKVFIVGQEGAQDESLSHRGFTGGTGAKMMGFLNALGIRYHYLFMNTFVYTINGQYEEPELKNLGQNLNSPVVKHRHELFNYMLETNRGSLNLVVAVGGAAKDTVRTWILSRGGKCDRVEEDGMNCDGGALGAGVKVLGVKHPGAAGKDPNAVFGLRRDFRTAFDRVMRWRQESGGRWLPVDQGAQVNMAYNFNSAPVPYADFAFGTTWRLGRGGTSSNRMDRQRSIQIFSAGGVYNDRTSKYRAPQDLATAIPGLPQGEIEWEFPKSRPNDFDPGPLDRPLAELMMGVARGFEYPNFQKLGVTQHPSLGYMGPYRGRLNQAQVLVLADQESVDDLFSGRAMTGEGGQRFQGFLKGIGSISKYAIVRVLPVDVSDLDVSKQVQIAMQPQMVKNRNAVLGRILQLSQQAGAPTKIIVTVGPVSAEALRAFPTKVPVVNLAPFGQANFAANWNEGVKQVLAKGQAAGYRPEASPTGSFNANDLLPIPRYDLPIHSNWWMGTSGSRAVRGFDEKNRRLSGDYYKVYMPEWVFRLRPKPLVGWESGGLEMIRRQPLPLQ